MEISPSKTEQQALQAALDYTNAAKYSWEIPAEEAYIKQVKNDAAATNYPKAEMIIVAKDFDYKKHEIHCCYKFDIYAETPMSRNYLYIDVKSGEVIATENLMETAVVPAIAATMYSANQNIITDSVSPNNYRLRDASRGLGIETYNLNSTSNEATAVDFTNTSTFWNTTTNYDNAAYDVHWAMESTYDYYMAVHNRNSIDNAGEKIRAYVHWNVAYNDAGHLADDGFAFGDGNNVAGGFHPFASIEICGHEFTHGVTKYTAGLHYGNESGALNESFSDIFGTCVEFYKKPATADFEIGEEIAVTVGTLLRSMSNPNLKLNPDTYLGTYWYVGGNDNGGVHKNSGVQNHWFYLLCQGGSGINDIGSNYNVSGIGITEAEQIAYRNLTVYLTTFSNYADARTGSIQAAQDLYGACSAEVIAVTNAWYAVGVGAAYSATVSSGFAASGTYSCSAPFTVDFTNTSVNAVNAHWDFGDGGISSAINPTHTYNTSGNYTVKLLASSSCGIDSLIMNSYITVNTPVAPTVTGNSACVSGALSLSASGNGVLDWYTTSTGGASINTGNNYTTPLLNTTTNYYVEDKIAGSIGNVGPASGTWAGMYGSNYAEYVKFNVLQACTLLSVKTNSYVAGTRTIQLLDNTGAVLQSIPVNLPVGSATILMNFPLIPGTGYALGGDSLSFAFDGSHTAYPYTLAGVAAITGNSISNNFYLFFYDWQFQTASCISARTAVTASIFPLPVVTYDASTYDTLNTANAPVTLSGGLPAGGIYSGTAVNNGIFNPSVSGAGDFTITYSYIDVNGCSNSATQNIHVDLSTGINTYGTRSDLIVYPNPSDGRIIIEFKNNTSSFKGSELSIYNVLGEKVFNIIITNETTELNLNIDSGLYFYKITNAGSPISTGKLVIN